MVTFRSDIYRGTVHEGNVRSLSVMHFKTIQKNYYVIMIIIVITILIIKLYCHFQHALHVKLECSLALTHIVPMII